ncbi:pyruvate kinase [Pontibacter beigongshangensis]|uniref:pyruvate kinase n=1 Tax=Pontibacter beigongshangensis TaxID=2574733 RepID=UPI00164F5670|nr:pyruvate kinase [Pontibacter beigongshangensis]
MQKDRSNNQPAPNLDNTLQAKQAPQALPGSDEVSTTSIMEPDKEKLAKMLQQIDTLHHDAIQLEHKFSSIVEQTHESFRQSARNLLHYLSLRQHDIRELQESLAEMGLSSLGRAEGHVLANLQAVRNRLCHMQQATAQEPWDIPVTFQESKNLLAQHTHNMLGPKPAHRHTRIMVTFANEFITNHKLIDRLLMAGMNCARINCAHDDETTWAAMIASIRKAEKELGIPCKILMDLAGPKIRTGPLQPGPRLRVIQPVQDLQGKISSPATIWLAPAGTPPPSRSDATLPVAAAWLAQLQVGDELRFQDTRGRKRRLSIVRKEHNGVLAHLYKTSYVDTGTQLSLDNSTATEKTAEVGDLPAMELPIMLKKGDFLELTRDPIPGNPAQYDASGHVIKPAHVSCTFPEVFAQAKAGDPILFDDGKIEGVVKKVTKSSLLIKITYANPKGSKLVADKGINLPESKLHLNELTEKDKQDLAFIARHADIVNLSFVNDTSTVEAVQAELSRLNATDVAVMLKIETKEGFTNLPRLLLSAMKSYPTGIMIARGDLAVECGWQRLAEVQEEILWLCEAAHMPVVWATQVLENLAKKGRPSRAEITDAAMSQRADCVMLNKGPYVIQAIEMLDDILKRMQEHQNKKTSMLRSLHVSEM